MTPKFTIPVLLVLVNLVLALANPTRLFPSESSTAKYKSNKFLRQMGIFSPQVIRNPQNPQNFQSSFAPTEVIHNAEAAVRMNMKLKAIRAQGAGTLSADNHKNPNLSFQPSPLLSVYLSKISDGGVGSGGNVTYNENGELVEKTRLLRPSETQYNSEVVLPALMAKKDSATSKQSKPPVKVIKKYIFYRKAKIPKKKILPDGVLREFQSAPFGNSSNWKGVGDEVGVGGDDTIAKASNTNTISMSDIRELQSDLLKVKVADTKIKTDKGENRESQNKGRNSPLERFPEISPLPPPVPQEPDEDDEPKPKLKLEPPAARPRPRSPPQSQSQSPMALTVMQPPQLQIQNGQNQKDQTQNHNSLTLTNSPHDLSTKINNQNDGFRSINMNQEMRNVQIVTPSTTITSNFVATNGIPSNNHVSANVNRYNSNKPILAYGVPNEPFYRHQEYKMHSPLLQSPQQIHIQAVPSGYLSLQPHPPLEHMRHLTRYPHMINTNIHNMGGAGHGQNHDQTPQASSSGSESDLHSQHMSMGDEHGEHGHGGHGEHEHMSVAESEARITLSKTLLGSKALKKGTAIVVLASVVVIAILAGLGASGAALSPIVLPLAMLPIALLTFGLFIPLVILFVPLVVAGLAGGRRRRRKRSLPTTAEEEFDERMAQIFHIFLSLPKFTNH